jgi:cytochrome c biogenesis protein CcdA
MINLKLLTSITGLALADAVNVCAFAVLIMVLVAILTKNPGKPKIALKAGLSFVLAVFLMYAVYGLVIFQIFVSIAEKIQGVSPYVFDGMSILIMIIGALNIKDFFIYRRGGIGTEMPLSLRPKVTRLINKMVSPKGSFLIGLFVTLFLLPCTIAPLVKAMDNLSSLGYTTITALPWLLYYNFLFIVPMIAIVLIVSFSFRQVEEVAGWQKKNIRRLHLISGILLFLVGLALLAGWL